MAAETVRQVFEEQMPGKIARHPELVAKIGASYKFVITGDESGTWVVDLSTPPGKVLAEDGPAGCTITMKSQDFLNVVNGKLSGQVAFMTGKLKVSGDLSLALKLNALLS